MSTLAQPQSGLLSLPAELRNKIYCYALSFDKPVRVRRPPTRSPVAGRAITRLKGLLLTCRQTHDEAIALFYRCNSFKFLDSLAARDWIRLLQSKGRLAWVERVIIHEEHKSSRPDPYWELALTALTLAPNIKSLQLDATNGCGAFSNRYLKSRKHGTGINACAAMLVQHFAHYIFGGPPSTSGFPRLNTIDFTNTNESAKRNRCARHDLVELKAAMAADLERVKVAYEEIEEEKRRMVETGLPLTFSRAGAYV